MAIFIVMVDNRPYGYFTQEDELHTLVEEIKKDVVPKFEFNKYFYWNQMNVDDEDVLIKWKCSSIVKNNFMKYECTECVLEVVKVELIEPSNSDDDEERED